VALCRSNEVKARNPKMTTNGMILIALTGAGATAAVDLWALLRRRVFGVPLPNYALVGRWIAHMARGRVRHDSIAAAPLVRAERAIGWCTHYLTGIAFAFLLPAFWGAGWMQRPALLPALMVGITTVAAPFFVMQPAMGAGFAASRTPRPNAARLQSLITHAMFGLGLYLAGVLVCNLPIGE
jgi:hypothetical protein